MADGASGTRERRDLITRLITRMGGLGGEILSEFLSY